MIGSSSDTYLLRKHHQRCTGHHDLDSAFTPQSTSFRTSRQFQDILPLSPFYRPSSVKTITGVAIYESVIASELLRSNSSGKRFAYSENTTAFQHSMSKVTDYLEVANFFCSKVSRQSGSGKRILDRHVHNPSQRTRILD